MVWIGVAELRMLLAREEDGFAVGRPVDRRCGRTGRSAFRQAPRAGGEAARFAAFGGDEPEMRRRFRAGRRGKSLSPTSKASLCFSISFLFSGSSEVTKAMCWPFGLHANCSTPSGTSVSRCASPPVIGQHEKLELRILGGGVDGFEGEAVAFGRPARRADAFAIVRERARGAGGDVDDEQLAVGAILLEIDARDGRRRSICRQGKFAGRRRW